VDTETRLSFFYTTRVTGLAGVNQLLLLLEGDNGWILADWFLTGMSFLMSGEGSWQNVSGEE
jgi:hypothetical protein